MASELGTRRGLTWPPFVVVSSCELKMVRRHLTAALFYTVQALGSLVPPFSTPSGRDLIYLWAVLVQ